MFTQMKKCTNTKSI